MDSGGGQGPAWTAQPIEKRRRNSQFRLAEVKVFSVRNWWPDKNQISTWTGKDTLSVIVAGHWLAVARTLLYPTLCSSQNVGVTSFYTLPRTVDITCIIRSSLCRVLSNVFKLWHQRCFPLNGLFDSFVSFEYLWIYVLIVCPYFWGKTSAYLKAVLEIRALCVRLCLYSRYNNSSALSIQYFYWLAKFSASMDSVFTTLFFFNILST